MTSSTEFSRPVPTRYDCHAAEETRLMQALLEDAFVVYRSCHASPSTPERQLAADVDMWVESDDRDGLFSFSHVCEVLHYDPEYVRRGFRRLKRLSPPARTSAGRRRAWSCGRGTRVGTA